MVALVRPTQIAPRREFPDKGLRVRTHAIRNWPHRTGHGSPYPLISVTHWGAIGRIKASILGPQTPHHCLNDSVPQSHSSISS